MKWPLFIAFEGIDKAGKGTQTKILKEWLEEKSGKRVVVLSEPHDDTPIGGHIRAILRKEAPFPGAFEMQRLFTVDRAQGWHCFIRPLLDAGVTCILERYAFSTLAYGMAEGLSVLDMVKLQETIVGSSFRWPDLTIVLKVAPSQTLSRVGVGQEKEHFEGVKFLQEVADAYGYLCLAIDDALVRQKAKIIGVYGMHSVERVAASVREMILDKFGPF